MNKKSLTLRSPYFFGQRIHSQDSSGNMPEWDRTENAIEDILRWADDGGRMLDPGNRTAGSNPDMAVKAANE